MALAGIRVVEFAGLAPGPFAGLVLADWGADVVRVDRPHARSADTLARGKRSVVLDIKTPRGVKLAGKLVRHADVLIDPFRPGVLERLGLGPEVFLGEDGVNKRLVYARLAGFSPDGPHRDMAGHDINYLALSGVLSMFPGSPTPSFPLNLLADFGGGGLTCALGVLLALYERTRTGSGQVVQVDMVSGTRYLSTYPLGYALSGASSPFGRPFARSPAAGAPTAPQRMAHTLDGGCPFYAVYGCRDARFVAVGCLEPQFYAVFLERFLRALPATWIQAWETREGPLPRVDAQYERAAWPTLRRFLEAGFALLSRDEWAVVFHHSDACVTPVLSPAEAAALAQEDGALPGVHPVLSRTASRVASEEVQAEGYVAPGAHTVDVLVAWLGMSVDEARGVADADTGVGAKL